MIDLTLQQSALRLCAIIVIAGSHGGAIAGIACALGDQGPRHDGRLSINPLAHLDILGTASAILFSIGWIKPIAIDPAELRLGRLGLIVAVLAGLTATFLSAVALRLARPAILPLLPGTASETFFALVETTTQLSLWFVVTNVLPFPPFAGGHILCALMPRWRGALIRSQPYAAIAMIILAATGLIASLLGGAYGVLARLLPGG